MSNQGERDKERKTLESVCKNLGLSLRRDGSLSPADTAKLISICAQRVGVNVALMRGSAEYEMAERRQN